MTLVQRQGVKKTRGSARVAPYAKPDPGPSVHSPSEDNDQENQAPPQIQPSNDVPDRSQLPASYIDVPLEEIWNEVPVYENAFAIRCELKMLIAPKAKIPGSSKTWNKTTLSAELKKIAQNHHPIKTTQGMNNRGPSVPSLSRFLGKSENMGGADSESYYFGNMLLEKLRIWNGEEKSYARSQLEKEFPNGRARRDPEHMYILTREGSPGLSQWEMENLQRDPSVW